MGYATPEQFMNRVERSKKRLVMKELGTTYKGNLTNKEIENLKALDNPSYYRANKKEQKLIRARAHTKDLRRYFYGMQ